MVGINFESDLGYILQDFKNEKLNHYEAMLKIETLVNSCLGFSAFHAHRCKQIEEHLREAYRRHPDAEKITIKSDPPV